MEPIILVCGERNSRRASGKAPTPKAEAEIAPANFREGTQCAQNGEIIDTDK